MFIILCDEGSFTGEPLEDLQKACEAGVIYECVHGWSRPIEEWPEDPLPCGYNHSIDGFFHMMAGQTMNDYEEAITRAK